MTSISEFFNKPHNVDVKIKILLLIDLRTLKYLCLINSGCRQICSNQKFWKYKILDDYPISVLPNQEYTTHQLYKYYLSITTWKQM